MTEFPFPITIKPASSTGPTQTVTCIGLLRSLGRKRKVLDATWGQRPVIVKVFNHPIKAKYHANKEWRSLNLLKQRGLNSPAPLFYGRANQPGWMVVTEKIVNAVTVREAWDNTTDAAEKYELLCRVSQELAKQHSKGVLQKDLHLGNFLLQAEKVFVLDPAQMRFLPGEANKSQSIAQLALLASVVPDENTDAITRLCEEYARTRLWKFNQADASLFWKELGRCKKNGIRKALKKSLRTSKRHKKIRESNYCAVAARDFFEKADFRRFVGNIDELMRRGQVLKSGNTCFVSHVSFAGEDIVIKRYNYKGILYSFRNTIKTSRARRCWLHAHRLRMLNIATPRPLTYIEYRWGKIVWKSYFVTKYIEGQKLYDFLKDSRTNKGTHSKTIQQVIELIEKLGKYQITHGDLKHSNILITEKGPVLTDLDGMKVHRWNWTCKAGRKKDMENFMNRSYDAYAVLSDVGVAKKQ